MIEITIPIVCELNKLCLKNGERFNILDKNRLESAIGNQWAPYPTDEQAIASVYRSLIQNHPFENGNKRTAVLVMLKMAESIGKKMALSHDELIDLTYDLAKEGGSQISTTSIANKLFDMKLEESLHEARQQTALKSNGVYSVLNDEWIKEPVVEDIPEINKEDFNKLFNEWESRYIEIIGDQEPLTDDNLIESQNKKKLYTYDGPIYIFKRFMKNMYLETQAVSEKQAINNFKHQAARYLGYDRANGTNVGIRDELVNVDNDFDPEEEMTDTSFIRHELCPRCKKVYLNDAGECPLCDYGDESVLEESSQSDDLQFKIEEIEDFIEDIYEMRKDSIKNDGEYGIGNLVFKEMRNKGYLDNLKDIKYKLLSKKLSLN